MEKDEVVKFLKENLKLELKYDLRGTPDNQAIFLVGTIKLGSEVVSTAELKNLKGV